MVKCGSCGQGGHTKRSRECPNYGQGQQQPQQQHPGEEKQQQQNNGGRRIIYIKGTTTTIYQIAICK